MYNARFFTDICDTELSIDIYNAELAKRHPPRERPVEAVPKIQMFSACFRSRAVAKLVASYFTNTEIVIDDIYVDGFSFLVKHPLLTEDTVLRILRKHRLRIDQHSVEEYWV